MYVHVNKVVKIPKDLSNFCEGLCPWLKPEFGELISSSKLPDTKIFIYFWDNPGHRHNKWMTQGFEIQKAPIVKYC